MAQKFQPCRLALALVLSAVLVLSVAQLTQAKIAHRTQLYPSQAQAEEAISYYYTHLGPFSGKNTIQHFDSITYRPFTSYGRFDACAQYQFAPVTSPQARQTARHLFTFEMTSTDTWKVISMDLKSC